MTVKEEIANINPDALLVDGFEEALIGYIERIDIGCVALYDRYKCIEILINNGMDDQEAIEYFEYNVVGSYCGKYTPAFATLYE